MILRIMIFLLASGAAGAAAWLTTQTGPEAAPPSAVEVRAQRVPTAEVLVAAADIGSGEVLSPEMMRWEPWPEQALNERFITREARPEAVEQLAGTFVNSSFATGEPIHEARLMAANANLMSNKIEPGMRAAAVKVSAESAAGGFILPGDRVDVLHTRTVAGADGQTARNVSRIVITNVRVLAIDQVAQQTPEGTMLGKTATLELTPAEAELIMAAEASGMLSLALRSVSDHVDEAPLRREPAPQTIVVHRRGQSSTVTVR